jgi:hypothetical protein
LIDVELYSAKFSFPAKETPLRAKEILVSLLVQVTSRREKDFEKASRFSASGWSRVRLMVATLVRSHFDFIVKLELPIIKPAPPFFCLWKIVSSSFLLTCSSLLEIDL